MKGLKRLERHSRDMKFRLLAASSAAALAIFRPWWLLPWPLRPTLPISPPWPPHFPQIRARPGEIVAAAHARKRCALQLRRSRRAGEPGGRDRDGRTADETCSGLHPEELPEPFRDFFNQFGQGGGEGGRQFTAPRKAVAMGSGFIIDRSGFIVTNNHVVEGRQKDHRKNFPTGREFTAKLLGSDQATDIRRPEDQERQTAAVRRIRRRSRRARRRMGDRRRQSVRTQQHGHRGHHFVDRPRCRQWSLQPIICRSTRRSTAETPAARPSICGERLSA